MPSRTKKAVKKSQIPKVKKSFVFTKWSKIFAVFAILGAIVWVSYRSMVVPTDINLVGSEVSTQKLVTDANGCYYQPVQCVSAPCEPIKVCPTNTTVNNRIPLGCTSWFDGCNTCSVVNGVATGCTKMACKVDPNNPPKPYCRAYGEDAPVPVPTSVPEPVICAQDMYACPGGVMVRRTGPKCEFICPTPAPTSTAVPSPSVAPSKPGIATFSAIKPCANNSFMSISFTCKDGRKTEVSTGVCTSLIASLKIAESTCN